jgi:hypothetical protein
MEYVKQGNVDRLSSFFRDCLLLQCRSDTKLQRIRNTVAYKSTCRKAVSCGHEPTADADLIG